MEFSEKDIELTRRALELAKKGRGLVSPNPLVGCVVTDSGGDVIGEGFYVAENVVHAEAIALDAAGENARGGTAYVSLEPHSHFGKTPPCTEALIDAGIKRVVCPIEDPNPLVSGKGFERLRAAGVDVVTGILAEEATNLNEAFICWHKRGRPFIHLKLALSLDGRISLGKSVSTTISNKEAADRVQLFRHEADAILVGATTAFVDDPSLTDRSGLERAKTLVRIVLDNRLRLPLGSSLVRTAKETPTVVFTNTIDPMRTQPLADQGVQIVPVERGARNLTGVLSEIKRLGIQHVLVEGGTAVAGAFVDAKLVDRLTLLYAPIVIGGNEAPLAIGGDGASSLAEALQLKNVEIEKLGENISITGVPQEIR